MDGHGDEGELAALRADLAGLRDAFAAIRRGDVDAVVVGPPREQNLYTLVSTDRPFRIIVDEMGEGAATVSGDGVILYANRRLAALAGRAPGEIMGSQVSTLVAPTARRELAALFTAALGSTERAEFDFVRNGETTFRALASVTGLAIDGQPMHCLVVADLTDRLAAELQLQQLTDQLRERAAELERANLALSRSNRALSDFAQVVTHDLAEPLGTIRGFTELLRERAGDSLGPANAEFLDLIESGVQRMHRIIAGILDCSRTGPAEPVIGPVEVGAVLHSTLEDLADEIRRRGATVDAGTLPTVRAGWTRLSQILRELVRNAITYVAPGADPHVAIRAERTGDVWCISVTDNGIGVPERDRERVFGILQRLDAGRFDAGLGLGLAIVQRNVLALGGSVRIRDNPAGSGTRVEVELPAW